MTESVTDAHLTVDCVLLNRRRAGEEVHVLMIRRADDSDAFPGHWALPGGYVDVGETPEQARDRELMEEANVRVAETDWTRLTWYADPFRDPRGRVVSLAFLTRSFGIAPMPRAGSDAKEAAWLPLSQVTASPIAFDHEQIIIDALMHWSD